MARLKLQLFALDTKNSIVDYLKSQGKDSSMTARKQIAQDLGIKNYSGTSEQNIQMLNTLKSQASSSSNTTKAASKDTSKATGKSSTGTSAKAASSKAQTAATATASATKAEPTATAISGVDQHLVDKANSSFTQSDNVSNAQTEADGLRQNYNNIASTQDIIDQKTWDALNSSFATSDAYNQAMAYTNQLLEQLSSGRTTYTDQIQDLMTQIQNREDFTYDVAEDTLFQQALSSAMSSGKSAMMDTIGQASALTGGYGSTYATSAGNQAYNAYIEDAYDNLPQYYQMALEAYQMEGQDMYNQLSMLTNADATEYQRMYDAWNTNFTTAQNMYAQEYGQWQDSINNAYNSASLQLNEHGMLVDNAFNMYQASQNRADTLYAQEYQKWSDEVTNAMNYMNMQNNDYWTNQKFVEEQRQYDTSLAWDKDKFAQQLAEEKRQHSADLGYKYSALAQDQAQYDQTMAYNKEKDSAKANATEEAKGKDPSETQYGNAINYYNTAMSSGKDADWKAFEEYMARLESMGVNIDLIESHIVDHGSTEGKKPSLFDKFFN